jgi:hypothetical protein
VSGGSVMCESAEMMGRGMAISSGVRELTKRLVGKHGTDWQAGCRVGNRAQLEFQAVVTSYNSRDGR